MDIGPQAIEEYANKVVYRFAGGRFEQALVNIADAISPGLKTLVNTDTTRSYLIPRYGISALSYKIDLLFSLAVKLASGGGAAPTMSKAEFFRVSAPTLNFDGRSCVTDFYERKNSFAVVSSQLRAINITNISVEPAINMANLQGTTLSSFVYTAGVLDTQLLLYMQPIVTFYKK